MQSHWRNECLMIFQGFKNKQKASHFDVSIFILKILSMKIRHDCFLKMKKILLSGALIRLFRRYSFTSSAMY